MNKNGSLTFAILLERYFLSYMITQKKVSPRTVATYRDSFTLYIRFLNSEYRINTAKIEIKHFSLDYLTTFGDYLEKKRKCAASTINLRISAIKSFLAYVAVESPEYSGTIRKALSLPNRKTDNVVIAFLNKNEYEAMLKVCEGPDFVSSRDKMVLMIMYNTGCRVSELVNLCVSDISLPLGNSTPSICFYGKGRKERITPIWKSTASYIRKFIADYSLEQQNRLFKNQNNGNLTRSGVGQRITVIAIKAFNYCPSIKEKVVTPHTFRHSAAMNLLQSGVDIFTIAIWLGHESIETTHKYMVADIELKRKAMEKLDETTNDSYSYKPSNAILDFLKNL